MLLIAFAEFEEISVTFAIDGLVSFTTENKEVISFALVVRSSVRLVITDLRSETKSSRFASNDELCAEASDDELCAEVSSLY